MPEPDTCKYEGFILQMHLGNYCGNIDIFIPNLDRRCNALSIMVLLGGGPLNIEVRIHFTLYCDIHIRAMPVRHSKSVIANNLILGSVTILSFFYLNSFLKAVEKQQSFFPNSSFNKNYFCRS